VGVSSFIATVSPLALLGRLAQARSAAASGIARDLKGSREAPSAASARIRCLTSFVLRQPFMRVRRRRQGRKRSRCWRGRRGPIIPDTCYTNPLLHPRYPGMRGDRCFRPPPSTRRRVGASTRGCSALGAACPERPRHGCADSRFCWGLAAMELRACRKRDSVRTLSRRRCDGLSEPRQTDTTLAEMRRLGS
jgi:hypothetical protein